MQSITLKKGGFGKIEKTMYHGKPAVKKKILINISETEKKKLATLQGLVKSTKLLKTKIINDIKNRIRNARREQRFMKDLKYDDGIAEIYDFDFRNSIIIMKLYEGNINQLKDKLNFIEKCDIVLDIVNGLDAIHSLDLIHSDLKCDNVLYEYDEIECRYKGYITDFGACNYEGEKIEAYTKAFFPHNRDTKLSKKNDIYSLGKTILEFFGIDDMDTLYKINYINFPQEISLAMFNKNKKLYNIVRNSLDPNPTERPELQEYWDVLDDILDN